MFSINRGVPAKREDVLLKDLRAGMDARIVPLVYGIEARFDVHSVGDDFYVDTDWNAPNHKLLKAEIGQKPEEWKTIIPEGKDAFESVSFVGGKLFVLRLHDVLATCASIRSTARRQERSIFPALARGRGRAADRRTMMDSIRSNRSSRRRRCIATR